MKQSVEWPDQGISKLTKRPLTLVVPVAAPASRPSVETGHGNICGEPRGLRERLMRQGETLVVPAPDNRGGGFGWRSVSHGGQPT